MAVNGHKIGAIKRAIENHIHPNSGRSFLYSMYKNWYIGITNDPAIRKAQHEYQKELTAMHFQWWEADSLDNALEIERHFHDLKMQDKHGAGGAKKNSTMVYVFKIDYHLLDLILTTLE